jgi:hypothetical protein
VRIFTVLLFACLLTPRLSFSQSPPPVLTAPPAYQRLPDPNPPRQPTRVSLPVPQFNAAGELLVQPNVSPGTLTGFSGQFVNPNGTWGVQPASMSGPAAPGGPEMLPPPGQAPGSWSSALGADPTAGGVFNLPEGILAGDPTDLLWVNGEPLVPWEEFHEGYHRFRDRPISPTGEPGLGRERVATAPFEIDISQPFGNIVLRNDNAYHLTLPDRAEMFWARPGRGPVLPERSVSYQDFRARWELGSEAMSLATDIPVRLLNPEVNGNTGGLSDIQLVQKTRMMDGKRWQITQLLRTVFNSGNVRKGLGTGHISMEPGVLCRYQYSDITYLHSQVKLMFPIAGDPVYSGPLFTWGLGLSHVWYETDTTAYIPTLEFINTWVLDGQVTTFPLGIPGPGLVSDVDGDGIFNLAPGLRIVTDYGGDLGVVELGLSSIFSVGSDGWYDALLRIEMRFVF